MRQRPDHLGLSREMSTDSVKSAPSSAKAKPDDKAKPGGNAEKAKPSTAIQNSLKRLQDAKDGKRGLKMLLLCEIKLTDFDISSLAPAVKTSTCLRSLSLYGCGLSPIAAKQLASAITTHESLTMLDLGNNAIGAKGVEAVSNALVHNSSILHLGMTCTDMQDAGATEMSHFLRTNHIVTEVYLNKNNITEVGAQELAGALLFNESSRLRQLFVYGNPLGEAGISEFQKLLQEAPMAQERVPMSEEMALAFVMGMHERLGSGSQMRSPTSPSSQPSALSP
jgi:hypothetical protein